MEIKKQTPAMIELPEHLKVKTDETDNHSEQAEFIEVSEVPGYVERAETSESDRIESARNLGRFGLEKVRVNDPSASALRGPGSGYTEVSAGRFVPTELVRKTKS